MNSIESGKKERMPHTLFLGVFQCPQGHRIETTIKSTRQGFSPRTIICSAHGEYANLLRAKDLRGTHPGIFY